MSLYFGNQRVKLNLGRNTYKVNLVYIPTNEKPLYFIALKDGNGLLLKDYYWRYLTPHVNQQLLTSNQEKLRESESKLLQSDLILSTNGDL